MTADADQADITPTQLQGPPWLAEATCRIEGHGTEFFTDLAPVDQVDAAVAVCHRCPVRWDCLAWAIEREDLLATITDGPPCRSYIYGGYTPDQREWLSFAVSAAQATGLAVDDIPEWLSSVADDVLST